MQEKNRMQNLKTDLYTKFITGSKAPLILLILVILMAIATPIFPTKDNLLNIIRQVAYSAILATGFTLVLGAGSIDLSLGSLVGLTGVVVAKMMLMGIPVPIAIIGGILFGMICGALNAFLIIAFDLPAFIVTLATSNIFKGAIYLLTKMVPVSGLPSSFVSIGQGYFLGIPIPIYIMLAMVLLMFVIINKTKFGRHALAMGGNPEATRVSGVNIKTTMFEVFLTMGAFAATASIVLTSRAASAQLAAGQGTEMDAIAAVVLGGTPMSGGKANVFGTLVGCLIVGVVNNGLNLLKIDTNWQVVVKGLMILFAIILDVLSSKAVNKRNLKMVG